MKITYLSSLFCFGVVNAQIINIEYGPSHYYSAADSPFYAGIQAGTIYLEDFEDGQLNTPYVKSADYPINSWRGGATRAPGSTNYINSVDADDGLIGDFRGGNGNSWYSYAPFTLAYGGSKHEFLFSPNELGQYPTYVGFVVTLVGEADRSVHVNFYGTDGQDYGANGLAPNVTFRPYESTTNHRFIGIYFSEGIVGFDASNVDALDHLQYGYSIAGVPEPSTYALMGLGLVVVACLARRRRCCFALG